MGFALGLIRWTARMLSLLSIGTILLFILGEGFEPYQLEWTEMALLVFFPLGVVLGMALAWRWEGLGGLVAVASVALFYGVHYLVSDSLPRGPFFFLFTLPGVLFGVAWFLSWGGHPGGLAGRPSESLGSVSEVGSVPPPPPDFLDVPPRSYL